VERFIGLADSRFGVTRGHGRFTGPVMFDLYGLTVLPDFIIEVGRTNWLIDVVRD
jgi:hypothetical protein